MAIEEMVEAEVLGVHMGREEGAALIDESISHTQHRQFRVL